MPPRRASKSLLLPRVAMKTERLRSKSVAPIPASAEECFPGRLRRGVAVNSEDGAGDRAASTPHLLQLAAASVLCFEGAGREETRCTTLDRDGAAMQPAIAFPGKDEMIIGGPENLALSAEGAEDAASAGDSRASPRVALAGGERRRCRWGRSKTHPRKNAFALWRGEDHAGEPKHRLHSAAIYSWPEAHLCQIAGSVSILM